MIRPKAFGIDPKRAIDRVVRAVGRMVVWVDAEAEVSTAMIRSLSSGEPEHVAAEGAEDVVRCGAQEARCRANACAEAATTT